MRPMHIFAAILVLAVLAGSQSATQAQRAGAPKPTEERPYGTMHFTTNLGSFKLIDGVGRTEFEFTGTVMISGFEGDLLRVTGDVTKEYEDENRVVYFGTGKLVAVGGWRGIQWFGRDLSGYWYGNGVARITGEFDQDLKTGWFWYDDPSEKSAWFANGSWDVPVPERYTEANRDVKPKRRGGGGG